MRPMILRGLQLKGQMTTLLLMAAAIDIVDIAAAVTQTKCFLVLLMVQMIVLVGNL